MATATAEKTENRPIHPIVSLQAQLEKRASELARALPSHMPAERFIRVVLTACQLNPDLLACDRTSLWNACMRAAQDGLLPDGREGAIVPYKDKAQWMPMTQGLLKRFRNSGQFKSITAGIVREGEPFEHWVDENGEHMKHVPSDGDGKPVKAYAVATMISGGTMIKVMGLADIEKRRKSSKVPQGPMWKDWWEEAAQKTVLRNLAKYLPTSSDLDDLIRRDDALYDFDTVAAERPKLGNSAAPLDHFSQQPPTSKPQRPSEPAPTSTPHQASEPDDESNPTPSSEPASASNPKEASEPAPTSSPAPESAPSTTSSPNPSSDPEAEKKAYDQG